jgi:WD40 repeat protein
MSVDESGLPDEQRLDWMLASEVDSGEECSESLASLRDCVRLLEEVFPPDEAVQRDYPTRTDTRPERIGRFIILGELGRGGFGVVFRAFDPALRRQVALKVPRPEFLANPSARRRFIREGWASSRLEHPHIVPVLEAGEAGPVGYIASAHCEGPSLAAWMAGRSAPVPPRVAVRVVASLASAIAHAHDRGVLHRDLKPANVILQGIQPTLPVGEPSDVPPFVPRLCDFGLAKLLDETIDETGTAAVLGSPPYMAPEQAEGKAEQIGPVTDIYGLGAILYELLTGRPPFRGETALETLRLVAHDDPPPPRSLRPGLARELETITLKCLEKRPDRRYSSADALADDLRRFLDGRPIVARPAGLFRRSATWARRYPARAVLLLFVVLSVLIGSSLLMVGQWWQARQNARLREVNARLGAALARAEVSEHDARRRLVGSMIRQAQDALDGGHDELASNLLLSAKASRGEAEMPGFAWSHLDRRIQGRLRIFDGGLGPIEVIKVSPDGRTFATHSPVGPLFLRDLDGGIGRRLSEQPLSHLRDITFSPDGRTLAASYHDGRPRLVLYDVASGREWRRPTSNSIYAHSLMFSADGRTLAGVAARHAASRHGLVFWDLSKGPDVAISILPEREARVRMAMERDDPTVRAVADTLDGRPPGSPPPDNIASPLVWGVSFTEDRKFSVIGRGGPVIEVRDDQGVCVARCIPYGPTSTLLVSRPAAPGLGEQNARKSRLDRLRELAPHGRRNREPLILDRADIPQQISPNGDRLAMQGMYSQPRLLDLATGATIAAIDMAGYLTSLAFTPDGRSLILGGDDGKIRIRSLEEPAEPTSFRAHVKEVWGIGWSPDGHSIATSSDDGTIKLWDVNPLGIPRERSTLTGHRALVTSVAWSPDGRSIASAGYNPPEVRIWDVSTGACRSVLSGHKKVVRSVAWSPDGRTIASASDDGTVRLWCPDPSNDAPRPQLRQHRLPVFALAWSPDSATLASAGFDGCVILSDVNRDLAVRSWDLGSQVFALAWSPDGTTLASAGLDGSIHVWSRTSSPRSDHRVLRGHPLLTLTLAFSPDGRYLASGGIDRTVRIWDPITGQELLTLGGHAERVNCVAFSPDGSTLASGDHSGMVKLWRGGAH